MTLRWTKLSFKNVRVAEKQNLNVVFVCLESFLFLNKKSTLENNCVRIYRTFKTTTKNN